MTRPTTRKPRSPRTVLSLSLPIEPDYTRAARAAGVKDVSLSEWIRDAMRQKANRDLGKEPDAARDIAA